MVSTVYSGLHSVFRPTISRLSVRPTSTPSTTITTTTERTVVDNLERKKLPTRKVSQDVGWPKDLPC